MKFARKINNFLVGSLALFFGLFVGFVAQSLLIGVVGFLCFLFVCAIVQVYVEKRTGKSD